jgi:hypothetical protein
VRFLPYFAIFAFVSGLSLLVAGFAFHHDSARIESAPPTPFDLRGTAVTTPPTETPPSAEPLTPTPTPFDGKLARMVSPDLGINNAIEEIGLTNNGTQLDTPKDAVHKVGWYYIYDKPGFGGNAVFAAHVNYNFENGPFQRLKDARPGEEITVQMEGGPSYTYKVIFYQRYDKAVIPTGELISAPQKPPGEEWITLITCGGRFVQTQANGLGEYEEREVVIASRAISAPGMATQ